MTNYPATAKETAAEYLDEGLWQDGADVLSSLNHIRHRPPDGLLLPGLFRG